MTLCAYICAEFNNTKPCPCDGCAGRARLRAVAPLTVTTIAGTLRVARRQYVCGVCKRSWTPWDEWAGMGKERLSAGARRLACRAGATWSFDQASAALRELGGLSISDQTIRRVCRAEGEAAMNWLAHATDATTPLRDAQGQEELLTDGTMVNTRGGRGGWREMRLTVASKRAAGASVDPATWSGLHDRALPKPAARLALAGIIDADAVGDTRQELRRRGAVHDDADASVIADGAKWIWNQAERVMPRARHVVDVYHVSEHLHACGAALHGPHTADARAWAESHLKTLVREGPTVLVWTIEQQARTHPAEAAASKALTGLAEYLRPNIESLRYADRRREGRTIGSGQVEGACKTIVGRRLKLNSARWRVDMADRMAALGCLLYSDLWNRFWTPAAA